MNYLLVNGATEINQKWGAAKSMGQWKHSSQEERSDAGEEGRFKAVCLINLHAAPIQHSGRAEGVTALIVLQKSFFTTSSHAVD